MRITRLATPLWLAALFPACVGAAWAEPLQLSVPQSPITACACDIASVQVSTGDIDWCCAIGVDDRVVVTAPEGWSPGSLQGDGVFQRTFTRSGVYTATFTADDLNFYGCEGDASVSKTVTIIVKDKWAPDPPISVQIAAPALVATGNEVTCTAVATDNDSKDCDPVILVPDELTYTWSANGGTTFKNGVTTGQTVTWIAPSQSGTYTISVQVNDRDNANLPAGDCGNRNDDPKSTSVQIVAANPVLQLPETAPPPGGPPPPPPPTGKSAVLMTGGLQNPVHQTVITARVDPAPTSGSVAFALQGWLGVNIHAGLSLTSTGTRSLELTVPLSGGRAFVYLTSSDRDPHEYSVNVTYGTQPPQTVYIIQATGGYPPGGFVCDPASVPADDVSTTTIRFCLFEDGTTNPVPGHAITFEILSVKDADGNAVDPPFTGYGSITQPNGVTGADGYATGTYKVGTQAGTINIRAVDNNDQIP